MDVSFVTGARPVRSGKGAFPYRYANARNTPASFTRVKILWSFGNARKKSRKINDARGNVCVHCRWPSRPLASVHFPSCPGRPLPTLGKRNRLLVLVLGRCPNHRAGDRRQTRINQTPCKNNADRFSAPTGNWQIQRVIFLLESRVVLARIRRPRSQLPGLQRLLLLPRFRHHAHAPKDHLDNWGGCQIF
jgi:hypothetical protein